MYYVYKQTDPRNSIIKYIGITNNPDLRFKQHLMIDESNYQKTAWVFELLDLDLYPVMEILETAETRKEATHREKTIIQELISQGVPLLNIQYNQHKPTVKYRKKLTCKDVAKKRTAAVRAVRETKRLPKPKKVKEDLELQPIYADSRPEGGITAEEAIAILRISPIVFDQAKPLFATQYANYFSESAVRQFERKLNED